MTTKELLLPRTAGSGWSRIVGHRVNGVVAIAALLVIGALALVGTRLQDNQASSRQLLISRFHDRADVVSALTQAVLGSAAATPEQRREYGGATVSAKALDGMVSEGRVEYAVLLDQHGVVNASRTLSTDARARVLASPGLKRALGGAPVWLSDVAPAGPSGGGVIDLAVAFDTPNGRRVLVSGVPTSLFSAFLSSYLRRVPTRDGAAYVSDSRGQVVASPDPRAKAGAPVAQPGLAAAVRHGGSGSFGRDGYFAAVAVPGSTWTVVLTTTQSTLFSSVSGSRKWLPWAIYVALGILALGFLALLRRLSASTAALSQANQQLAAGNARLESSNALLRQAAELQRSNAELEQFASIASHDLQEPLRKVQTFAAHLSAREHERLSEEGQDFLRRMNAAAGRMRALIDDLLMFSRVSTKGKPFVPVDLNDVVSQVLVDLELGIEETGARVSIAPLPTIAADPVQMRQLMQNLLGNALKFRRDGVVPEVDVTAHVTDGIAELTVRDNGMGFEAQYASRIFRAFERLNGASAYPGTGIGLALCRKIVERHNGAITADGEVGKGATFSVMLPLEQQAGGAAPFPSAEPLPAEASHALL
jgi:signal transduction histidine kinase